MTTTLAEQLKKLAVPQTQVILGADTRKESFIYTPQEAAGKDRETFYYIGKLRAEFTFRTS